MNNLEINDIFTIVDVPDNSIYVFTFIVGIVTFFTATLITFLYIKFRKYKKKKDVLKHINILKNCDFDNARESAYKIEYYSKALVHTGEEKKLLNEILQDISLYKYHKNVLKIPDETKKRLYILLDTIENNHV